MNKLEVGEKRPLSTGYIVDRAAKKSQSEEIAEQTAEFIAKKGKVEEVEFGVMKKDNKGVTALRINHEK